jgi:hypothetical protein
VNTLQPLSDDQVLQAASVLFEQLSASGAWEGVAPGWDDVQVWNDLLRQRAADEGAEDVQRVLEGSDRAAQVVLARQVLGTLAADPAFAPLVDDAVKKAREQHLAPPALLVGAAVFLLKAAIASIDVDLERTTPEGRRHLKLTFEPDKLEDYLKKAVSGWIPLH